MNRELPSVKTLIAQNQAYLNGKKKVNEYSKKYRNRLNRLEFMMHLQNNRMNANTMRRKFGMDPNEIPVLNAKLKRMRNRAPKVSREDVEYNTHFLRPDGKKVPFMPFRVSLGAIMKTLYKCNRLPMIYETKPRLTKDDVKHLVRLYVSLSSTGQECKSRTNLYLNNKSLQIYTTEYKKNLRLPNRKHHRSHSSSNNSNSNNNF